MHNAKESHHLTESSVLCVMCLILQAITSCKNYVDQSNIVVTIGFYLKCFLFCKLNCNRLDTDSKIHLTCSQLYTVIALLPFHVSLSNNSNILSHQVVHESD